MKKNRPNFSGSNYAILRISESKRQEMERCVFQRHPKREWGTFFRFGYRRTSWGLLVSIVDFLPPKAGDLDRGSHIVSFRPDYISRMTEELENQTLGIGVVHSHPLARGVYPSPSDDDMDTYFAHLFGPYGNERPYISLIVNQNDEGQFEFSGRAYDRSRWMPIKTCFTVGQAIERDGAFGQHTKHPDIAVEESNAVESITARWELLVGPKVTNRFKGSVVGIVGCSGTGSPAIEALARAQIGEFVLVDHQRIGASNLERMHGSRLEDINQSLPPYKIEIMARMIREVNKDAKITMMAGNILDNTVIDELLRCDVVLGCTDTQHGRAGLGDLASLYLLPAIDVGVLLRGQGGRLLNQHIDIMRLSPNDPCPFCRGRINPITLSTELASEEERDRCRQAAVAAIERGENGDKYWNGDHPILPTVGYLTTAAGALAAGYALNWLLGTSGMPHSHFQFDINAPEFAFASNDTHPKQECSCVKHRGQADLGNRSVTMPPQFSVAIRL